MCHTVRFKTGVLFCFAIGASCFLASADNGVIIDGTLRMESGNNSTTMTSISAGNKTLEHVAAAPATATIKSKSNTSVSVSETQPGDVVAASTNTSTAASCTAQPFRLDGRCNHVTKTNLGGANTPFQSLFEPVEVDPNSIDLPSPRLVSNLVSHEVQTPPNRRFLSEFFTFFGQFLDHTIAETHATKRAADIPIPADDRFLAPGGAIPFNRTHKLKNGNWDTPENIISSYVDGSAIYGVTEQVVKDIREFKNGFMKLGADDLLPMNNRMHFIAGDVRANENPALQSMHTLWVREHNRVAKEIHKAYPEMKEDEDIFKLARFIVVAEFQQVVFHEFVPAMLGRKLPKYLGYSPSVDGTTSNEFATVAYRVGHSLVNPVLTVYDDHGKPAKKKLSELFFQTSFVRNHNIDGILLGILTTRAAEIDVGVTSELRNFLFPDNPGGSADLVSLNLMRARDHGIPPYNTLRQFYGLRKKRSFTDITKNRLVAKALHDVYAGDVNKIDPWIGGLAEDHYGKGSMGELFTTAWISEFSRMRDGNRLYYENDHYKQLLPKDVDKKILSMKLLFKELKVGGGTMKRILKLNTKIPAAKILDNPFFTKKIKIILK